MLTFLQCDAHFLQRNEGCANVTAISAIYVTVHVHTYVQSYQSKDLNKTYDMVTNLSLVLVHYNFISTVGKKKHVSLQMTSLNYFGSEVNNSSATAPVKGNIRA